MVSFASDYMNGVHPKILDEIIKSNSEILPGYGEDCYCRSAIEKIKNACKAPDAQVFFINGGTQTNQLVISTMLSPWQGVIAAKTGHVSLHEAGAIEYTGHKVIELKSIDGKLKASDIETYVKTFYEDGNYEHMVFPGMVYISLPTEYGTLYSKKELADIYEVCRKFDMTFYIDGARLIYALGSRYCNVTLADMAKLCDVFYIGGTKAGTLCGEALVFTHGNAPKHYINQIKQHGALSAKGRLYGVQFDALFTNNLYLEIGRKTAESTDKLKDILTEANLEFFIDSPTNQQFVVLSNEKIKGLEKHVGFSFWEKYDNNKSVVRFAVSWSTTDEELEELRNALSYAD